MRKSEREREHCWLTWRQRERERQHTALVAADFGRGTKPLRAVLRQPCAAWAMGVRAPSFVEVTLHSPVSEIFLVLIARVSLSDCIHTCLSYKFISRVLEKKKDGREKGERERIIKKKKWKWKLQDAPHLNLSLIKEIFSPANGKTRMEVKHINLKYDCYLIKQCRGQIFSVNLERWNKLLNFNMQVDWVSFNGTDESVSKKRGKWDALIC